MKFLFSWKGLAIALAILIALVVIWINVRNEGYKRYDDLTEFEFELDFGPYGRNNLNTFNDTLTKDLVLNGTKTVEYVLPKRQKRVTYNMLKALDIMNCPEDFTTEPVEDEHVYSIRLRTVIDGEEKEIRWRVVWGFYFGDGFRPNARQYQLKNLIEYLTRYIVNTQEWLDMPPVKGGYL